MVPDRAYRKRKTAPSPAADRPVRTASRDPVAPSAAEAAAAYVPRILLESLASHPERPIPWWEWVEGTLVMADVSGFTMLSERLAQAGKEGAEWLTDVINRFFGRMLDLAWECGGTTLTFGGDAILLLFYGDDHERRGIAAALRMLHGTETLPAYRVGNHRVKLAMSMGAHAGRFLTASAGTCACSQYLILGPETVKTAQAEARASSGQLAITPELAERVGVCAVTEPLGDFLHVERLVDTPRYAQAPHEVPGSVATAKLVAYLPPFVVGTLVERPDGPLPELDHEHRNVSVVFVNVLGADDLLESEGPDALVEEVQRYLEPVVRLVGENHGCLVSNDIYTNGFKLIVAFGAPVAHEHDAENAFRFAATLKDEIDSLGLKLTHRIGVNGGFVFAGDVGPSYRRQYTVMGDAVNLSARLMSAADPGRIIVSARAAEAAGSCFLVRELPAVHVKGKEQPIEIGSLEGQCEPAPATVDNPTGFFGREEELAALDLSRESAERGEGRAVVIRGEAGMGKSRLIAEFERTLPDRGWRIVTGRAYEHTASQPYAPWLPILSAVTGFASGDDEAIRSTKTLEAIERAGSALTEWAALLNPLLGLSLPLSDLARSLDARSRRERMFDLVAALLSRAADDAPLAVHLEDAHWADGSSVDLLEHAARECSSARVLLLIAERFKGAPEIDLPATARMIDLRELPQEAALGLMGAALSIDLPRAAAKVLLEKAKGNPLFLQEVARSISRSSLTAAAGDAHSLTRLFEQTEVPDRVQGLLMSQVDMLAAPAREILRTASVVGTTFQVDTLRGALGTEGCPVELEARLAELVAQSLLVERDSGRDRAYDFRHALIQEVAYDSLPFAKRRVLHHKVAEYLEASTAGSPDAVYESLVHHYQLSGDRPKTRAFAVKAGEKAQGLLASDQAIDFFRVGLGALAARTPPAAFARSCLMERIGDCYHLTGRHNQAARSYRDALDRSRDGQARVASEAAALLDVPQEARPARNREAHLCHKVGVSYTRTHDDYRRSLRWLDRAIDLIRARDAALASRIDATRSVALLWMGEYAQSVTFAKRAYTTARRRADCEVEGRAATTLAGAFQELGQLEVSTRYRLKALECYVTAADVPAQAEAHSNLAATYICRADLTRALHHAREALKIDERTGDLTGEGMTRCNLAEILVMRGDYAEATKHLQTAVDLLGRAGGASHSMGFAKMMLSRAFMRSGQAVEAAGALDEAVTLLHKSGATTFLAEARVQHAELLLLTGALSEALAESDRGRDEARYLGMRLIEMRALWMRGRILGALGENEAAAAALKESASLARQASAPYERGLAELALAELYAESGRPFRRPLSSALSLLEPTGALPDIERARKLAATLP